LLDILARLPQKVSPRAPLRSQDVGTRPRPAMTLIEWRKEFETGIPEVDVEHAQLIDLINKFLRKLDEKPSREIVDDILAEIDAKIASHFAFEEKIMRERGYDKYADHKADHERLLVEIRAIRGSVSSGAETDFGSALRDRISAWFVGHFKSKDVRLHKTLE